MPERLESRPAKAEVPASDRWKSPGVSAASPPTEVVESPKFHGFGLPMPWRRVGFESTACPMKAWAVSEKKRGGALWAATWRTSCAGGPQAFSWGGPKPPLVVRIH
jgi:hypothetical protein